MRNDVNVNLTILAVDNDCIPEIVGMIGASIALSISDIPFAGPISGVSVGLVDGEIVMNPTEEQRERSEMAVTVASTEKKVTMIEAGAKEVPEAKMLEAIMAGHKANAEIIAFINTIVAEIGREKFTFDSYDVPAELFETIKAFAEEDTKAALHTADKICVAALQRRHEFETGKGALAAVQYVYDFHVMMSGLCIWITDFRLPLW